MSVFQPDTESGQRTASDLPAFQVVRRGYDPNQVDAYVPQLIARLDGAERARAELQREVARLQEQAPPSFEQLGAEAAVVLQEAGRSGELLVQKARRRAETIIEQAQQQAEQVQADVTGKAQTVLAEANEAAEHVRQQVQQEQAALDSETEQVREFRDGLLEDLGRVHADISALLERTRGRNDQAPAASGDAAGPAADAPPDLVVEEASELARLPGPRSPSPCRHRPMPAASRAPPWRRRRPRGARATRRLPPGTNPAGLGHQDDRFDPVAVAAQAGSECPGRALAPRPRAITNAWDAPRSNVGAPWASSPKQRGVRNVL
jgi:DivIVA domain-containing protein